MKIAVAGTAGAAGVALLTQLFSQNDAPRIAAAPAQSEICLKGDFSLFAGVSAGCYSHDQIVHMADMPLIDRVGAKVTVVMTHPTDLTIEPKEVATCRGYREARFDGWYAATSRDMRREGFFIRACGALALLNEGQKAEHSYFKNGSPLAEDVASVAASMKFGEMSREPDALRVERGQGYVWRISADDMSIAIHEIANADFDNDGVEEILAFTAGAPAGGTAAFYQAGLLEKDAADAPLAFTPLDFSAADAAGTGG